MSGWDTGGVFFLDQGLGRDNEQGPAQSTLSDLGRKFREFIRNFRQDNTFLYREQLRRNYNASEFYVDVDMGDVSAFDEELAKAMQTRPADMITTCERSCRDAAALLNLAPSSSASSTTPSTSSSSSTNTSNIQDIQLLLSWNTTPQQIRQLTSDHIGRLVAVHGIVISTSRVRAKATDLALQCRRCGWVKHVAIRGGMSGGGAGGNPIPRVCDRPRGDQEERCPLDSYVPLAERSSFVDQQTLKLQELPEHVPTGEMPRHCPLTVDRYLVGRVAPGTRVTVVGVYSVYQSAATSGSGRGRESSVAVRSPYIRVLGLRVDTEGRGRAAVNFSAAEEQEFLALSRSGSSSSSTSASSSSSSSTAGMSVYERIATSIDPAILGHEDVKRAIAIQLFGGTRRKLPDGMRLRGDINVLLVGDPSAGKSQLLKFVEKVAPIGVYTSGKGSSAAGLTAAVIRDPSSGEFYFEGGSLVLADGGIVCIDEFDKMREQDRVAIHEAMEQQTISLAKAGITTVLNSRTSILAAANPIFGRYDDLKTASEQLDFQSSILSRFDLIFLVRDIHDSARDQQMARHVLGIHTNRAPAHAESDLTISFLKKYIAYARAKCRPTLSEEAAEVLKNHYVTIRTDLSGDKSHSTPTIPITVRQLEAVIRISEALAKLELSPIANVRHVEESIRLFRASTVEAARSGISISEGSLPPETLAQVQSIEGQIRRRLAIGSSIAERKIVDEMTRQGYDENMVRRAIVIMCAREELELRNRKSVVRRVK